MPWLALPFSDRARQDQLSRQFECNGIPHLVLLDSAGGLISTDGRSIVTGDPSGSFIPEQAAPTLGQLATQGGGQRLGGPGSGGGGFDAANYRPDGIDEDEALAMAMAASMEEDLALVRVNSFQGKMETAVKKIKSVACLETIGKILSNIETHPGEAKYRSLRKGNAAIQEKIIDVPGGENFLLIVGFEASSATGESILTLQADESKVTGAVEMVAGQLAVLKRSTARKPAAASSKAEDPARAAIRARIEADKKERSQRTYQDSRSEHKGFGAGEKKSATALGADGSKGG